MASISGQLDSAPRGSMVVEEETQIEVMSQRQLIWRRFRKHKLAMAATVVVLAFYSIVIFADFLATNEPFDDDADRGYTPPQGIRLFDGWVPRPHVCARIGSRDEFYRKVFVKDCDTKVPITFFARGYEYKLLGITFDRHLIGISDPGDDPSDPHTAEKLISILGSDEQGRDLWSRLMRATRLSLLIGLLGIIVSLVMGTVLGAVSGFAGGIVDNVIQRSIEIVRSIPTVPLYLGLAAAFPADWSIERRFFAITIVVSLFAWTELARVTRGRFLAMRSEDFVTAAVVAGASRRRVIFRHMLPSFYSHIIAASTLALAFMIINETVLSFLGLGLQAPAISYGVLLFNAQNLQSIALAPWLLIPGVPVVLLVLALNFMGDGIRDAADPYGS